MDTPNKARWQHRIEQLEGNRNIDAHLMAKLGEEHWELVSVVCITPSNIKAFFKRPADTADLFQNKTIDVRVEEEARRNGKNGLPPAALRNNDRNGTASLRRTV